MELVREIPMDTDSNGIFGDGSSEVDFELKQVSSGHGVIEHSSIDLSITLLNTPEHYRGRRIRIISTPEVHT